MKTLFFPRWDAFQCVLFDGGSTVFGLENGMLYLPLDNDSFIASHICGQDPIARIVNIKLKWYAIKD